MTHTPTRGKTQLIALAILACFGANGASAQATKAEQHARMIDLQGQIQARKSQPDAAAQLAALQAEFNQISASLGGDVPCAIGAVVAGSSSSRAPAPSPTGCAAVTTTFTQATPVAIPTGPAVVTSTIAVSGAGAYLWDVDATTFITHTFAADLDITITSPAGTVVTLTTDNGAGNDDVFNGTVWDDDANPGGTVPYTNNNGVVTDHTYANLTLASPLVPEEALAAFVGENPNGTWTITISDDLAGDGGNLASWSLGLTTFATAPIQSAVQAFNQTTPVAIPTGPAVVTSTIAVAGLPAQLCKAVLRTNISHTFAADLDITLTSPAGTVITVTTDNGAGNDNVFAGTTWDDDANPAGTVPYTANNGLVTDQTFANLTVATPLVVEESMGALMGEDGNGTWTLTVSDDLAGDGGSIDSWGLDFITCTCASADISVTLNDAPDPVAAGGNLTYTAVVTNNGPTAATDMSVSLPLPAGLVFVSSAATGGGTCAGTGPVVCTWAGSTAVAGSQTATIVATVPANAASGTIYTATATASSATSDPVPGNNTATTTTTVTTNADLLIGLTASATQVAANVPVTFTATSLNQGPSDAQNVVVTVTLTPDFRYSSHTATGATCTVPQVGTTGAIVCTWAGATAPGVTRTLAVVAYSNNEGTTAVNASTSSATPDPVANNNLANISVVVGFLVEEIPSLSSLGLVLLGLMLGLAGFVVVRRQA